MAFTDLQDWVPVQYSSDVLERDRVFSAVETAARKVNMTSDTTKIPRFAAQGVDNVAKGATIPLQTATVDSVLLDAYKFADRFAQASEDEEDAIADAFQAYKNEWLSNFAIALDNACLGTVGTQNGTTRPFTSVYQAVGSGNRIATSAGANITFENLKTVVGDLEANRKGGLVVIAHPAFAMQLRDLKDASGLRVVDVPGVLGAGVPTVFGHELVFSYGARTNTTFSDSPTGNPIMVVANKSNLIVGVRSGPEARVSDQEQWSTDNIELKMRARRAFVLADSNAARVIELTPAG